MKYYTQNRWIDQTPYDCRFVSTHRKTRPWRGRDNPALGVGICRVSLIVTLVDVEADKLIPLWVLEYAVFDDRVPVVTPLNENPFCVFVCEVLPLMVRLLTVAILTPFLHSTTSYYSSTSRYHIA